MGRHGGGSSSGGGGGGSRRSGGSRSGGSSSRSSKKPFAGSYNRSYYDRRGRYHSYYTTNRDFGTRPGWNIGTLVSLIFITVHMCLMLGGFASGTIQFGSKVDGDVSRIKVVDKIDLLTDSEEQDVVELFNEVYEKSGMPVTLYTDDYSWKTHYHSLEVYSEELYYKMGVDEDAMIILFTADEKSGAFWDWEYDMYCGDDTIKCLSDPSFDKLLDNFQKAMAQQDLKYALDYAWDSVIDELARTSINMNMAPVLIMLVGFYGIFYVSIIKSAVQQQAVYNYFQSEPQAFNHTVMRSVCPNCGASNAEQRQTCPYCGAILKVSDNNTTFV